MGTAWPLASGCPGRRQLLQGGKGGGKGGSGAVGQGRMVRQEGKGRTGGPGPRSAGLRGRHRDEGGAVGSWAERQRQRRCRKGEGGRKVWI